MCLCNGYIERVRFDADCRSENCNLYDVLDDSMMFMTWNLFGSCAPLCTAPKTKMASWKILHLRMYLLLKMWIFQLAMLLFGRVSVFVQLLYGSGKYLYLYYDLVLAPDPKAEVRRPPTSPSFNGSCCCKLLLQQFVKCTPEHEH